MAKPVRESPASEPKPGPGRPRKVRGADLDSASRWAEIEKYYVEGDHTATGVQYFPSIDQLADRFHMAPESIQARARNHKWRAKQDRFRDQLERVRQEAKAVTVAQNAAEFDNRSFNVAQVGMESVGRQMAQVSAEIRMADEWLRGFNPENVPTLGDGRPDIQNIVREAVMMTVSQANMRRERALELKRLAEAAKALHELAHDALGDIPAGASNSDPPRHIQSMIEQLKASPERWDQLLALPYPSGANPVVIHVESRDAE